MEISWLSIVGLLIVALTVVLVQRVPAIRSQWAFGALCSLPVVGLELLIAGTLDRLGGTTIDGVLYLLTTTIVILALGGLAAVVTDITVNRWWTPKMHPNRHLLRWFLVGAGVSILLMLFGWSAGLALLIGVAINTLIVLVLDRTLVWDVIISSSSFALWFVVADLLFGARASGDIDRLLIGQSPIGITLSGLPIERLLVMILAGCILGPVFSATKHHRSRGLPVSHHATRPKMIYGLTVVGFVVLAMSWWSWAYVWPPQVVTLEPTAGKIIPIDTESFTVRFSRPITRDAVFVSAEPAIDGWWEFTEPTLSDHGYTVATFHIEEPLIPNTNYLVVISGIESVWGVPGKDVRLPFTTAASPVSIEDPLPEPQPAGTTEAVGTVAGIEKHVLPIALDYQDSPLSCEAAALKMALAGVGVKVSERQIMKVVGYDPTVRRRGIWGDPNRAFVGNIAGRQNTTGYGVHWDPIARAAKTWRNARVIKNITPSQVAIELAAGHPIVIWGTMGPAYQDYWKTPSKKLVAAWKGEHARTVIGYSGTTTTPVSFVINDPIAGRQTWSTKHLTTNLASFQNHAVVIE